MELSDTENKNQIQEIQPETTAQPAPAEPVAAEGVAREAEPISKAPEPVATGSEQVSILKHDIYRKCKDDATEEIGIEMVAKNLLDETIGSVSFEALLYDIEGKVMDTVSHKEIELPKDFNRTVRIILTSPDADKVKSYAVKVQKVVLTPPPVVQGNDRIMILKHSLSLSDTEGRLSGGVDFAIRNISDVKAASIFFEAKFLDIEGNVVETAKHKEIDLPPETSRAVLLQYSGQDLGYKIKSYSVKLVRMTTADSERVQLRRNEIRTLPTGEEEVEGIIKNISSVKTDAALVANFFDSSKENIGSRVMVLRDIEPETIRRFQFKFKPQPGDTVRTYTLVIGDIAENLKQP